jgi:hypothetical protein
MNARRPLLSQIIPRRTPKLLINMKIDINSTAQEFASCVLVSLANNNARLFKIT